MRGMRGMRGMRAHCTGQSRYGYIAPFVTFSPLPPLRGTLSHTWERG